MFDGLYQSVMCFFIPYLLYWKGGFVTDSGLDLNSTSEIGVFVACGTITIVNLYILLNQQHWDWLFLLIITFSVFSVWAWTGIYSQFQVNPTFYKIASHVFGTLPFWAVTLLMIVVCLLPRFTAKTVQKLYYPYDSDIIREQVRLHMFDEKTIVKQGNDDSPAPLPSPPKRKGFLTSASSGSAVPRKSRSPSPAKLEAQYTNDDERPIYPPSVTQSQATGRPMSQSDTEISSDTATGSRHHRRSTDHTERWHSHTSPMIPEIVELR
jgi:phospholipid-translocating ATPase